ncbi:hypothetical protein, partial [Sphingobium sp. Ndbn-10]
WNKLAAGKSVETIELPKAPAGIDGTIVISPGVKEDPITPEARGQLEVAHSRVKVHVGERLARPHPIIVGWVEQREREIKKRQQVYDFRLRRVAFPSPFSAQERRRHRVLDALLKALEANQAQVIQNERRFLHAVHGKEKIEFQLRVKLRQVKRPLSSEELRWHRTGDKDYRLEFEETDILIFEIKSWLPGRLQRIWQDSRSNTIEAMVEDILATILAAFPLMVAERERQAEQERRWKIEEQRRSELQQQRKLEQGRFRRLLEHAGRWRDAELAKNFVAALRESIPDPTATIEGLSLNEWLEWAESRIVLEDPLANPHSVFASIAKVNSWTYRD